jgi:hypothetical protein
MLLHFARFVYLLLLMTFLSLIAIMLGRLRMGVINSRYKVGNDLYEEDKPSIL